MAAAASRPVSTTVGARAGTGFSPARFSAYVACRRADIGRGIGAAEGAATPTSAVAGASGARNAPGPSRKVYTHMATTPSTWPSSS
eukprot:5828264-Heterocapsa_arctica.AAC.1